MDPAHGTFSLLGPVVGWGSVALAVIAFVLGITLVPRWIRAGRAHPWRGRLLQALALLLCAALAVATTGIWLNRSFVFFDSWGDVVDGGRAGLVTEQFGGAAGAGTAGGAIRHRSDTAGTAVPTTAAEIAALEAARTAPPTDLQAHPLADRTLAGLRDTEDAQYVTVRIPAGPSGISSTALVHLPPGYLSHPERRYPVLLAFSGIPGSPETWRDAFALGETVDGLARRDRLAESIVVIPAVFPGQDDTECVDPSPDRGPDAPAGHPYETWIVQDVAGWARTHLRTIESPFAWATIGYSAGGWCASMLSVRHPDLARASISLAGYFLPDYAAGQEWTAPDDPRYDLPAIAARERPPVVMYFFAGGEDALAASSLPQMERSVSDPTALTVRHTRRGGHMITLWIAHLPMSLSWLGAHEAGFAPPAHPLADR